MRPIQRIKHVVDGSATVGAGVQLLQTLASASDAPTLALTASCQTGSTVNGIYLHIEVASNEAIDLGAIPNVYLIVLKNPGANITAPQANGVGSDDNKRFVIHQEMLMIENKGQGSNARTLFNGVVVIPKGYRRMGPGDLIQLAIKCPSLDVAFCFQAHYKEFR